MKKKSKKLWPRNRLDLPRYEPHRAHRLKEEKAPDYTGEEYCRIADWLIQGKSTEWIAERVNRDETAILLVRDERFTMNRIGSTNEHDRHDVVTTLAYYAHLRTVDIDRPIPEFGWGGRRTIHDMLQHKITVAQIAVVLHWREKTIYAVFPHKRKKVDGSKKVSKGS